MWICPKKLLPGRVDHKTSQNQTVFNAFWQVSHFKNWLPMPASSRTYSCVAASDIRDEFHDTSSWLQLDTYRHVSKMSLVRRWQWSVLGRQTTHVECNEYILRSSVCVRTGACMSDVSSLITVHCKRGDRKITFRRGSLVFNLSMMFGSYLRWWVPWDAAACCCYCAAMRHALYLFLLCLLVTKDPKIVESTLYISIQPALC